MRTVDRRYLMEFFPAMAAHALVMLLAWPYADRIASPLGRAAIALLPVVPTLPAMRAILRRIRSGDERERRLALASIAVASALIGVARFALGFLVKAKVIRVDANGLVLVQPALIFGHGLAHLWLARHDRAA